MIAVETSEHYIHVRIPRGEVRPEAVDAFLDWLRLSAVVNGSLLEEAEADSLAEEFKAGWWQSNRHRFVGGKT